MKKVIAAFNAALVPHTTGIAGQGLHQHYAILVDNAGIPF